MHTPFLVAVALVACALMPTTPGATTSAIPPLERVVLTDPVGDAWTARDTSWAPALAEGAPPTDVGRAVVAHRQHGIVLRLWFADLRPMVRQSFMMAIGAPRASHVVTLGVGPRDRGGTAVLTGAGVERVCPGLAHTVDTDQNEVSIRVPRRCVDWPRWITASSSSTLWRRGAAGSAVGSFTDNPHNAGLEPGRTARLRWPGAPRSSPPKPSRVVLEDPTGDVWTPELGYQRAVEPTVADVVRAVVWHSASHLVLRLRFADLRPVAGQQILAAQVVAQTGVHFAGIEVAPRRPQGSHYLIGPLGSVACPGLRHRIDLEEDLLVLRIPRRCLGDPAWLRVSLDSYYYPAGHQRDGAEVIDNPHNGRCESGTTPWLFAPVCVLVRNG